MPGSVLKRHQLVKREVEGYRPVPDIKPLTLAEVQELVGQCDEAVANYAGRRGRKLYDHRRIALGDLSKERHMPDNTEYGVNFVGYAAYVVVRKDRRHELHYGQIDFVTGGASVIADEGWVRASSRIELSSFMMGLASQGRELRRLLRQRQAEVQKEGNHGSTTAGGADDLIGLAAGETQISIRPGTNTKHFIRQVSGRFAEIEQVLEQAEQIGARIERRPYEEYIDEIARTGFARVEAHGFGRFEDGKLIFFPDHRVALTRRTASNTVEIHSMERNLKSDDDSVH